MPMKKAHGVSEKRRTKLAKAVMEQKVNPTPQDEARFKLMVKIVRVMINMFCCVGAFTNASSIFATQVRAAAKAEESSDSPALGSKPLLDPAIRRLCCAYFWVQPQGTINAHKAFDDYSADAARLEWEEVVVPWHSFSFTSKTLRAHANQANL
jgi:hypothetical protein